MAFLTSYDGTRLAYHVQGHGPTVVCLPGGPMQDSAYLGDLGGLASHHRVIRLDLRGTGQSAQPTDPDTFRCDRLVDDVEALRRHLDLDRMDLLAHCAGANLATLYTARHPAHVGRLALVTPSVRAVGGHVPGAVRRRTALLRRDEPWFPTAFAALEEITAGRPTADAWQAVTPFSYGQWNDTARAHHAAEDTQRNDHAAAVFGSDGAFTPTATRAALTRFPGRVLVLAGEVDVSAPPQALAEFTDVFPGGGLVVQPGAGHFPWMDDGERFTGEVAGFLTGAG